MSVSFTRWLASEQPVGVKVPCCNALPSGWRAAGAGAQWRTPARAYSVPYRHHALLAAVPHLQRRGAQAVRYRPRNVYIIVERQPVPVRCGVVAGVRRT